jgi:N-acyl-D-amino-acid deacylase
MMRLFMLVAALSCASLNSGVAGGVPDFDFVILNARIVDGSGNPWFRGSVGIRGGLIEWIAETPLTASATRVIDAEDRVLAPGFIDLMGQSTLVYLQHPETAASRLTQGITTHFSGEGWSHAPQNEQTLKSKPEMLDGKRLQWRTFEDYFAILQARGVPLNVVHNVGAEQVRRVVLGDRNRAPSSAELEKMRGLVDEAMRQGAAGLSSALIYPPGSFATTEELIALAEVVSRYGGFYSTHIRNESDKLLEGIDEAITIGRRAGVPVHIYHLKAAGEANWPLMKAAIERITDARASGLDVTADIYPYVRNGIGIESFVPPAWYSRGEERFFHSLEHAKVRSALRHEIETGASEWENWYRHVGCDWGNVLITGEQAGRELVGLSIREAAVKTSQTEWDFFFNALRTHLSVAPLSMNEEQKNLALTVPWIMIETDTAPASPSLNPSVHPRAYGSFARVLAKYVRTDHILTLEDAIRRMSSEPANRLGLYDRGRIAAGFKADLVLFDPAQVQDHATFANPSLYSSGIAYVWVNGRLAVDSGRLTSVRAGEVIRFQSSRRLK